MTKQKHRVPAIDGWFIADGEVAHLLGSQCKQCRSFFFPKETFFCRNPACRSTEFEEVALSRRGKLWSFTDNRYAPPAPYLAPDPFVPYIIAAVELDQEKMVVLGQVVSGVELADLRAGQEMELVLDKLFEDAEKEYLIWKWRPVAA